MTAARVTREAVDGLLDHAAAQTRAVDELKGALWWATDIILEVRDLVRRYDLPIPIKEERLLVAIEHYVHTCPIIDADLHRLPMPFRTETPGGGVGGEAAPPLGPAIDIAVEEQIAGAFADLKLTEDEDGRP